MGSPQAAVKLASASATRDTTQSVDNLNFVRLLRREPHSRLFLNDGIDPPATGHRFDSLYGNVFWNLNSESDAENLRPGIKRWKEHLASVP
jgi:hypothetical protein